jgi:acetyl-CoA synthetase
MLERFLPQAEFKSYEDFITRFSPIIPDNFNFAYDVADVLAEEKGRERALVWCDERGGEAVFTYADMRRLSNQAANLFRSAGIGKGDPILVILKRRWHYWPVLLALHKIGAVAIPATHLLTVKDLVYRCEAADVAGIICVDDEQVLARVDEAEEKLREKNRNTLRYKAFVRSVHSHGDPKITGTGLPWADFNALLSAASPDFSRLPGVNTNSDMMLLYFTSGTTGNH